MELEKNKKLSITKQELIDLEKTLISLADGENIIADNGNIVYHDKFKYKHTFADSVYVREMTMFKDTFVIGAIHKHLHMCFLLQGHLTVANEKGVIDHIAPCFIVSTPGTKRVLYAHEDSIWYNTHKNPTNIEDVIQLEKDIVCINYKEYEEYINQKK